MSDGARAGGEESGGYFAETSASSNVGGPGRVVHGVLLEVFDVDDDGVRIATSDGF